VEKIKKNLKIPIKDNYIMIVYTKDIYADEELNQLKDMFSGINLDTSHLIVPSEYIKKIRFIKRKWKK